MRHKKITRKSAANRQARSLRQKSIRRKTRQRKRFTGSASNVEITPAELRGMGPRAGGQSGDIQALPALQVSGPESVEELVEEGQDYEAELIGGVENAPDADESEIYV